MPSLGFRLSAVQLKHPESYNSSYRLEMTVLYVIQHSKYSLSAYLVTNNSHVQFLFLGCLFIFIGVFRL